MAGKLTDAKMAALKAPETGQAEHSDSDVPGLRVRIGSTGIKTFILRKRVGGKVRNITIGRYGPRLGIAEARRKARALVSDLEAGKPPPPPKLRKVQAVTVRDLLPAYLQSKIYLRSIGEIERILRHDVLPVLGDRMADTVTRADVTRLIDDIAERSPSMARAVFAQLSAFYEWALPGLEHLAENPCRGARRPDPAKARDRVLTDEELRLLWRGADWEYSLWGPGVQLLMLTGARRDEVFSAEWAEFDLKKRVWTIPGKRSKNGVPHRIPLSCHAVRVLSWITPVEGTDKLFPARRKGSQADTAASGFSKAQARLRQELKGSDHWTFHDIRRTVATGLQRLGVRFEVTEAILNHVSGSRGGVAGIYQRYDWEKEKREALDLWGKWLMRNVRSRQSTR